MVHDGSSLMVNSWQSTVDNELLIIQVLMDLNLQELTADILILRMFLNTQVYVQNVNSPDIDGQLLIVWILIV